MKNEGTGIWKLQSGERTINSRKAEAEEVVLCALEAFGSKIDGIGTLVERGNYQV